MIKFQLGFHAGNTLSKIALTYPTLLTVILELVQNSLDSGAKEINVMIDYAKRIVRVRDNGDGIAVEKFALVIGQVCGSVKGTDKLGQFGMGLLSPLGKCKFFTITSIPKGLNNGYNRWLFDSHKLLTSRELPQIPHSEVKAIYSQNGGSHKSMEMLNYRTEVSINEFKADKTITAVSITELQRQINSRFSEAMKKMDTQVSIYIKANSGEVTRQSFKASQFRGEKINPVVYGDEKSGKAYFEIYISPKMASGRKGEISVGIKDNMFRIGMKDFLKSISHYISPETFNILSSGTFEGFIISDACTLHPNRKEFMDDDTLVNLVINIEEWVKNHARPILISMKDSEREEWLQVVGAVAMGRLETRLKNASSRLLDVIRGFKKGFVVVGPKSSGQDYKSKDASSPSEYKKGKGQQGKTPVQPSDTFKSTVAGPNGQRRRSVVGSSTGLQFVYEELAGNSNHWEFDMETGILSFNMRSNLWEMVERTNERNLIDYQERIAISALRMCCAPEAARATIFSFLQEALEDEVSLIVEPSTVRGRKATSKVGKKV